MSEKISHDDCNNCDQTANDQYWFQGYCMISGDICKSFNPAEASRKIIPKNEIEYIQSN